MITVVPWVIRYKLNRWDCLKVVREQHLKDFCLTGKATSGHWFEGPDLELCGDTAAITTVAPCHGGLVKEDTVHLRIKQIKTHH